MGGTGYETIANGGGGSGYETIATGGGGTGYETIATLSVCERHLQCKQRQNVYRDGRHEVMPVRAGSCNLLSQ